jgi:hypothetical protein
MTWKRPLVGVSVAALVTLAWAGLATTAASSSASSCSKATAREVVERLGLSMNTPGADPVGKVLCGAFTGPGSRTMVVVLAGPTGLLDWVVFRWTGSAWQLVMRQSGGASITAAGSDIRQTISIYRERDPRCCPSGGTKSRLWHWNGTRFVAGPWKQVTRGEPEPRAFDSPSLNINCFMSDGGGVSLVRCQSREPQQRVTMDARGRLTICRNTDPLQNSCNLGDRGEGPTRPLAYGKRITVGRFRCDSLVTGVRCVVTSTGKGFLINRDGVRRLGP